MTVSYVADVWGGMRRQIGIAAGAGREPGLPARSRLSHAHVQHRARRHPGGVAARTDRGDAPADRTADAVAADPAPAKRRWGRSRCPTWWRRRRRSPRRGCCCRRWRSSSPSSAICWPFSPGAFRARARPQRSSSDRSACRGKLPLSLPADLVRQRPDVRAAEANLHAANAQIGVAIANRLPQITLTGNAGSTACAVSHLFAPRHRLLDDRRQCRCRPMFDAGTLRQQAARRGGGARRRSVAQYRSTVLAAFQNVADTLRALQADARALNAAIAAERSAARSIELVRGADRARAGQHSVPAQRAAGLPADIAGARAGAGRAASPTRSRCSRRSAAAGGTGGKPQWYAPTEPHADASAFVMRRSAARSLPRRSARACRGSRLASLRAARRSARRLLPILPRRSRAQPAVAKGRHGSRHGRPDAPARASSRSSRSRSASRSRPSARSPSTRTPARWC